MELLKKLKYLLDKKQKLRIGWLCVLKVVGAFLETLGISMMIPYIAALTSTQKVMKYQAVRSMMEILHIQTTHQFLIAMTLALIGVYTVKNLVLYVIKVLQNCFVDQNRFEMSQRLMRVFLNKPYEYYMYTNSSTVLTLLTTNITRMYLSISELMGMFSELVLVCMMVVFLFVVNWRVTIGIIVCILLLSYLIKRVLNPRIARLGTKSQVYYLKYVKAISDAYGGIKEVKVHQREGYFYDQLSENGRKNVEVDRSKHMLSCMSKYLVEEICICGMLIVVLTMLLSGVDIAAMIPTLSTFALAAIRLIPSANRINIALSNTAYYKESVLKIDDQIRDYLDTNQDVFESDRGSNFSFEREMKLEQIGYQYPNTQEKVLEGISLTIPQGKSIGIIGISGSGKSTIMDVMLGLVRPQEGDVTIDEKSIYDNQKQWLSMVGYIPQDIFLLDDTIRTNIVFGYKETKDERIWEVLKSANLYEFVKGLPEGLSTKIGERGIRLSGGQRQRLGIARALYHNPSVILCDEATSALDAETEKMVAESLYRAGRGKTSIIIAHRLTTIKNCDVIYQVKDGLVYDVTTSFSS